MEVKVFKGPLFKQVRREAIRRMIQIAAAEYAKEKKIQQG